MRRTSKHQNTRATRAHAHVNPASASDACYSRTAPHVQGEAAPERTLSPSTVSRAGRRTFFMMRSASNSERSSLPESHLTAHVVPAQMPT
jgi:hypothetical protein